jgi:hypothetical protein
MRSQKFRISSFVLQFHLWHFRMLFSKILCLVPILLGLVRGGDSNLYSERAAIITCQASTFGTTLGSTCACANLKERFPNEVLFPNSTAYFAQATDYYDLRADLSPKCIFFPASAEDISKGIIILDICQSQFAIR